ncbi:GNAT family N-acetyltransferase [Dactylosporangium darangshiense]|uniref:GNAT family N-acetyltransferase n=1 Tax=Dactylosporangium darangshiense TaxID=579108 RepID=UPI0031F067A0
MALRRFPSLLVETPRLTVRPLCADDDKRVAEIFADRLVRRWLPVAQDELEEFDGYAWCTELAVERRDSGAGDHYGIVRREDERLVGCLWTKNTDWLTRSTEIAYAVAADARGYGVAPEAVDVLALSLLLEHRFQRVELRVAPGNVASRRVAEKAGFTYEGLLRNAGSLASGRVDLESWSLLPSDIR